MAIYRIYHNPRCSKSRQTLALLQDHGIEPEIILYLEKPPTEQELAALIKSLAINPRDLLRKNESEYKGHKLDNPGITDQDIIAAMVKSPKLIERPIVTCGQRAIIGRPPEKVRELL